MIAFINAFLSQLIVMLVFIVVVVVAVILGKKLRDKKDASDALKAMDENTSEKA